MTNEELIDALRARAVTDSPAHSLMNEAADALEASESRVKELEAQVKEFKCEQVFRISEMQELVEAQARVAELEAKLAARQPSENDREALKRIAEVASEQRLKESIGEWREALGAANDSFPDDWELEFWHAGYKHGALAMIEHQLSRAAVPDAATEVLDAHKCHESAERAYERTIRAEAERDAALAAIERVREIHRQLPVVSTGFPPLATDCVSCINGCDAPCSTIAALDGAPEPEWEYGFELIEPDDRNVFEREGDFISAAFAYRAAKKRIDEEHQADLPRLQYLIVRRRKGGQWQPVESEGEEA